MGSAGSASGMLTFQSGWSAATMRSTVETRSSRRRAPLGHIVEDDPREPDEEHSHDHDRDQDFFHGSVLPYFLARRALSASSSASTFSDAFNSAISSSSVLGSPPRFSASARPSARSTRRSSTSKREKASCVRPAE